ncbi:MAG: Fumble domain-containing protein [Anaerolineaceae bacterium]|nr:Fumble domain-containing protein [Anaerolineaceae bacterium]
MTEMILAADIGMTNIDLAQQTASGVMLKMLANPRLEAEGQLRLAIQEAGELAPGTRIGVTGGRYRDLPESLDGFDIQKVDEILAVGLGGLALTGRKQGLVVSAGTGTAMVAARGREVHHVTGSAVGGGTLLGLSKLLLGTDDPREIDHLALAGDAAAVDIMLREAVGGQVGRLPEEANAVNLGKLNREETITRENLAAGLVRLVAQVIAVIAINAANAEGLGEIILIGHLMDLAAIRREIALVGTFYDKEFIIPENPGFGTVTGVLEALKNPGE